MKKAIWAIYNHRTGNHTSCPQWCHSHSGNMVNMVKANKHRLPTYILCDIIKPIFERLAADELLQKCIDGGTQNANEAFHHCIWERVPIEQLCGVQRLALGVNIATVSFNDGEQGVAAVFQAMGVPVTPNHCDYAMTDKKRVLKANIAVSEPNKTAREKSSIDKSAYDAGSF